ncbi:MAG TPA: flagellar hook-basal body complex protein FliE [Deltaproteobacteria bacterium]|nr:MAG: flagellar hook-basal body complex protein FliE [Deltaproteobacteria bacterium GWA2_55_82]OGQ64444.1 MAG: flagellar hook-basal body complex protein FliE [Deltaproteobacteria bacterium RIFCSPLOWO2_02_FULL_55_12]OIJ72826.1 MAG: flagellar hook-basal body complex protein FliE [Deltaproteobacteria bacterium GWC2_55_46]HBG46104.1 flagellar hook-basal body complex protein FliE [Deltaproteobacteria bacterium]HCY11602.1 flagellar hook-basal body complex protein FliE [Deltaproteobacteria bacterium
MVDSVKGALSAQIDSLGKAAAGGEQGTGFSQVLKESIDKVNSLHNEADKAIEGLSTGQVNNIHDTMIAIEKANLSFNLMVQVRNKLVQAYEEIMRTQV